MVVVVHQMSIVEWVIIGIVLVICIAWTIMKIYRIKHPKQKKEEDDDD